MNEPVVFASNLSSQDNLNDRARDLFYAECRRQRFENYPDDVPEFRTRKCQTSGKCPDCLGFLYYIGFYYANWKTLDEHGNKKFTKDDLERIWNDDRVHLQCCECIDAKIDPLS